MCSQKNKRAREETYPISRGHPGMLCKYTNAEENPDGRSLLLCVLYLPALLTQHTFSGPHGWGCR